MRREAKEKLKDEAKLYFYYSSNRWGVSSNMPKLGMVSDQRRIKFADFVVATNTKEQDLLPNMESTLSLGKEWRYYKRSLDNQKRAKKNEKERNERLAELKQRENFKKPQNKFGLGKRDFN